MSRHQWATRRYRAPSGNRDADYWFAQCACGWESTYHPARTVGGKALAIRDGEDHATRVDTG